MHCSTLENEGRGHKLEGGEVLVAIAALVIEGRIPDKLNPSKNGAVHSGPHSYFIGSPPHDCNFYDPLCLEFAKVKNQVLELWQKGIPLSIDVFLKSGCQCGDEDETQHQLFHNTSPTENNNDNGGCVLLEQWIIRVDHRRINDKNNVKLPQLINAVRSQLYFSQLSSWLSLSDGKISEKNVAYRLSVPGETYHTPSFANATASEHNFPVTDIGDGLTLQICLRSLPRTSQLPLVRCNNCSNNKLKTEQKKATNCNLKGKHRCEDFDDTRSKSAEKLSKFKRICNDKNVKDSQLPSTSKCHDSNFKNDTNNTNMIDLISKSKSELLLEAILKSSRGEKEKDGGIKNNKRECDSNCCDFSDSYSIRPRRLINKHYYCDSPVPKGRNGLVLSSCKSKAKQKLTFDDWSTVTVRKEGEGEEIPDPVGEALQNCHLVECGENNFNFNANKNNLTAIDIPSSVEQLKFKKSLDNATSMVFHSRTGLPLTSSPAPVRRGKSSFDYDSSINSVSSIGSALFSPGSDEESESDSSIVSPRSPDSFCLPKKETVGALRYYRRSHPNNLLGTFEESVLNGRLDPVSTVQGFTAELGASGSFVPKHVVFPVTVFFYSLGDNDKVSTPYLGHINLGRKGYQVPKSGTIQVTLFNPLGTVIKMFVILYDLNDMPPYSQTFLRQRTLYMPANCKEENLEWGPRWLRYLIHLRFMSSKSGKIYLHKDIRMIIFRKSDLDTATAHDIDMAYELRSFTHQPNNPKFSPRKK